MLCKSCVAWILAALSPHSFSEVYSNFCIRSCIVAIIYSGINISIQFSYQILLSSIIYSNITLLSIPTFFILLLQLSSIRFLTFIILRVWWYSAKWDREKNVFSVKRCIVLIGKPKRVDGFLRWCKYYYNNLIYSFIVGSEISFALH